MSAKHVAVLMGGWSSERPVSLVSGAACAKALREEGYRVSEVDVGPDVGDVLSRLKPDIAFNALHGRWGEDGCVQGILEILRIPYTHSGVLASALAMHKERAKHVFRSVGLPCAKSLVVPRKLASASHQMEPPYVVKPVNEGSSVGVFVIRQGDNRPPGEIGAEDWKLGDEVMVEEFIPGRELTVAVMNGKGLAVTEIIAHAKFYDFDTKYAEGGSEHIIPARIPEGIAREAIRLAEVAHAALGCRGVSRTDIRFDDTGTGRGRLVILEVNTQPGMTPTSLVPEQAQHNGISFGKLVRWMVEDASCDR